MFKVCYVCTEQKVKQLQVQKKKILKQTELFKIEIMKNTVKQFAAGTFMILLLSAGNVKAEETEFKSLNSEIIETSLQLEGWMTDETIWNLNSVNIEIVATETESLLEIEAWMISENVWSSNLNVVTESEDKLELESWMTTENTWNVDEKAVEADLVLENWMFDNKVWK